MDYESKLSDIIASLPEVDGGFLYSAEKGIYSNQTDGIGDDDSLLQVSVKLNKVISMLAIHFHDVGSLQVSFKDLILFGILFEDNQWLFLFHHPSLSPGMVKMTVQMALNIEQDEDDDFFQEAEESPAESTEKKESLVDVLLNDESELQGPLRQIQEELARHIGPVAELVFVDAIEKWSELSPSLETLPKLLTILEREIDDEVSRGLFNENLQSLAGESK